MIWGVVQKLREISCGTALGINSTHSHLALRAGVSMDVDLNEIKT
jgi:hypothetical protein